MKALDTNTLVRLLVADDRAQHDRIVRRLIQLHAQGEVLHVASAVWIETIWVLRSSYDLTSADILPAFARLAASDHFSEATTRFLTLFVAEAGHSPLDLPDLVIAVASRCAGADAVLTFDRGALRSPLFAKV